MRAREYRNRGRARRRRRRRHTLAMEVPLQAVSDKVSPIKPGGLFIGAWAYVWIHQPNLLFMEYNNMENREFEQRVRVNVNG